MVPGSTLMYGSSFIMLILRPRASRMAPSEAEAMPLPSEDTTPPVTNTKRAMEYTVASVGGTGPSGNCRKMGDAVHPSRREISLRERRFPDYPPTGFFTLRQQKNVQEPLADRR